MKSTARPVKKKKQTGLAAIPATYWLIGIVAVMVVLALIVLLNANQPATIDTSLASGNILGKTDAPVRVDEFSDFQCPSCGNFARRVLPQLEERYIKTGKIQFAYNHFAFLGEESTRAAEASECANDQGKFWDLAEILFNNQAGENLGAFSDVKLEGFAQQLGLNMEQYKACMADRRHLAKIQRSNQYAQSHGVQGTPTLFVNGVMVNGNSLADLEKAMLPFLNAAR